MDICNYNISFRRNLRLPRGEALGRRFICCKIGIIQRLKVSVRWQFADYSWSCDCGERHCSECSYVSDGVTVVVHGCGRLMNA